MTEHKISWLNMPGFKPETWNPIVGCSKVSPGCDNCYAEKMAVRLTGIQATKENYSSVITNGKWNGSTNLCYNQLNWPLLWKTPRMVFVCSMSDLFHESISFETIEQIHDIMLSHKQHIFIVLTKRPERAYQFWNWFLNKVGGVNINDVNLKAKNNIWLGVTAEKQEQANKRIPILLSIPAAKRFVSIEPMLGPVELGVIHHADAHIDALNGLYNSYPDGKWTQKNIGKLDWLICGGESGPKARPMHPDWVRSVRDQCDSANVPFFFKQWGEWKPYEEGDQCKTLFSWANDSERNIKIVSRVGRKAAGNLLDGEQHHNWPNDQEKCKIGSEACVYHACMDDGCQKQHMLKVKSYGLGDCEKPKTNIQ